VQGEKLGFRHSKENKGRSVGVFWDEKAVRRGRPEDISGRKTLEDAGGHHKNGGRQEEPNRF